MNRGNLRAKLTVAIRLIEEAKKELERPLPRLPHEREVARLREKLFTASEKAVEVAEAARWDE